MERDISVVGAIFSAATLLGTLINAIAARRSADAATRSAEAARRQVELTVKSVELHLEEGMRRIREFDEARMRRHMRLAQRVQALRVQSFPMDNDVRRIPGDAGSSDLSLLHQVAEFRVMFLAFMDSDGAELAALLGIDSVEWVGLRYLEDMVRWCGASVPHKFTGQDDFYKVYGSVNQHLLLVHSKILRGIDI